MSDASVFVVEDDDQIREALCEVFEMEGYGVLSAAKHSLPKRPDVAEFLPKPMDLTALLALVARYCSTKQSA